MDEVAYKIQQVQTLIKVLIQLTQIVLQYFPDTSETKSSWEFYNITK